MNPQISLKQFTILTVIGRGNYAKVLLARYLGDNSLCAIKVLKKKFILEAKHQSQIMTQKNILAAVNHPFLIKLKMSFQDEKKLYFVLEYCPGGELFSLLSSKGKITEEQAKFYAGQIVLALGELHKHRIIYRDLKPENILLDRQGYIKLTDFGLSKMLTKDENAKSICGTPEYIAPEIITKVGHGIEVDWWCLGCLIYEMVNGSPPFEAENRMELFENILYKNPNFSHFSSSLKSLLGKLLAKEPQKRLGYKSLDEIKSHPWFSNLNWSSLLHKKIKTPFIVKLSSQIDTTNFDEQFTKGKIDSAQEIGHLDINEEDVFKEFST